MIEIKKIRKNNLQTLQSGNIMKVDVYSAIKGNSVSVNALGEVENKSRDCLHKFKLSGEFRKCFQLYSEF